MTVQEVREHIRTHGMAARDLLVSPAYVLILNHLSDIYLKAMIETAPGPLGSSDRDLHHHNLNALRTLHGDIEAFARDLESLEAAEREEQETAHE